MGAPSQLSRQDIRIESWKKIAAYFSRDERTVKRWEHNRALPVHRLPGTRGGVFAYKNELDAWINGDLLFRHLARMPL